MAIRQDTYYEENKNLSLKDVMKKIMEIETWLNSDERKAYEEAEMAKPMEERIDDGNIIENYKSKLKVLRRIEKEQSEKLDETFKLSNGKYATDLETKEAFDNYMNKVNRYNEQVANGETPDVSMGDILNEYTNTFYDEELEAKLKKTEDDFNNREKDTKIDDLINQIDNKLESINMEDKIKTAANEIIAKIAELPIGSEFVMGEYFADYKFELEENFKLMEEVISLCKSNNIQIENTQDGMILGMPWVYKYKKNN